jgi:flagellar basal body-associated protein FliL
MQDYIKNSIIHYLDNKQPQEINRNELGEVVRQTIMKVINEIRNEDNSVT